MTLTVVERPAADGENGALVLFHGRGADEHDLLPLLDALDPNRRLDGFCPRGPLSLPPGGAHWYRVQRVGYPDPETFAEGYAAAAQFVDSLPHSRVVLGGFSQGAVMALALGLGVGRPKPTAVIAFSGFIPEVEGWELDTEGELPPVAIAHGTHDEIIGIEFARSARDRLEEIGHEHLVYRESPMGHTIDPQVVSDFSDWLHNEIAWH